MPTPNNKTMDIKKFKKYCEDNGYEHQVKFTVAMRLKDLTRKDRFVLNQFTEVISIDSPEVANWLGGQERDQLEGLMRESDEKIAYHARTEQ